MWTSRVDWALHSVISSFQANGATTFQNITISHGRKRVDICSHYFEQITEPSASPRGGGWGVGESHLTICPESSTICLTHHWEDWRRRIWFELPQMTLRTTRHSWPIKGAAASDMMRQPQPWQLTRGPHCLRHSVFSNSLLGFQGISLTSKYPQS